MRVVWYGCSRFFFYQGSKWTYVTAIILFGICNVITLWCAGYTVYLAVPHTVEGWKNVGEWVGKVSNACNKNLIPFIGSSRRTQHSEKSLSLWPLPMVSQRSLMVFQYCSHTSRTLPHQLNNALWAVAHVYVFHSVHVPPPELYVHFTIWTLKRWINVAI